MEEESRLEPAGVFGRSLADDIASGPLHPGEVVWIGRCLADQLDRWHRVDVVRGLVRPADVLWTGTDRPLLSRFATQPVDGDEMLVAPEVRAGRPVTIAADIYSLGATLVMALVGGPAELDGTALRSLVADDVPDRLIEVLEKATARSPVDRHFTAAAFRDELDAVVEVEPGDRSARLALKVLALAAAVLLIGLLGVLAAAAGASRTRFDPAVTASGNSLGPVAGVDLGGDTGAVPPGSGLVGTGRTASRRTEAGAPGSVASAPVSMPVSMSMPVPVPVPSVPVAVEAPSTPTAPGGGPGGGAPSSPSPSVEAVSSPGKAGGTATTEPGGQGRGRTAQLVGLQRSSAREKHAQ